MRDQTRRRVRMAAGVGVIAGAALILGCSDKSSTEGGAGAVRATSGSGGSTTIDHGNVAGSGESRGAQGANGSSPEKLDVDALAANAAARERAVSAARAWVLAHRETGTISEQMLADIEAEVLELLDRLFDGEELSLGEILDLMTLEQKARWAADEDMDGELSAEETAVFSEMEQRLDPMSHPYVRERFDADGDGEVSDAERDAAMQEMQAMGMKAFSAFTDRAALVAWDADGDGHLTDAEREAAFADEAMKRFDFDGDGVFSEQERMAALFGTMPEFAMALQNPDPDVEMPEPPQFDIDWQAYDADGDGQLSPSEVQVMQVEREDELRDWRARWEQAQLNRDVLLYDTDGDGRLSYAEREAGLAARQQAARRQIFMLQYDTDRSGGIEAGELSAFMAWHRDGAPRADADLNGVVDQADLQLMLNRVGQQ